MDTTAKIVKVAKLIVAYQGGRTSNLWQLSGDSRSAARAHIMSEIMEKKTPKSKSGITAMTNELFKLFEVQTEYCGREFCPSEREKQFWSKVVAIVNDPKLS